MYKNMLNRLSCRTCGSRGICFLQNTNLQMYPESTQNFIINVPQEVFLYYDNENKWHADYRLLENYVILYFRNTNSVLSYNQVSVLTIEAQREKDELEIKRILKNLIDEAAKVTENSNLETSIMFDEIGLIFVSDYYELISKVLSIMKKGIQLQQQYCNYYRLQ